MDIVRWGLIGSGEIARKAVVPAFSELKICTLTCVASRQPEKAEALSRDSSAKRRYTR